MEEQEPRWYVIHTYSGYEIKVKKNLEHRIITLDMAERIFRVEVPTVEEIEIKVGQRHPVQRKIFPGYVLVEMTMDDESWYVVVNTPGVTGYMDSKGAPVPVADEDMDKISKMLPQESLWFVLSVRPGQETDVKNRLEQCILAPDLQDRIFQVEIPTRNGTQVAGFVLVKMLNDPFALSVVQNTPGVTKLARLNL